MDNESHDFWDYRDNFDYDLPLEPGDERLVDFSSARGSFSRDAILRQLRVNVRTNELRPGDRRGQYILFGGHRGCGKSTELRFLANQLHGESRYFTIFLDALRALDINNLRYSDIALALSEALVNQLAEHEIEIEPVFLEKLHAWFDERVQRIEQVKSLSAEIRTGARAETGLPLLGKLFASLTTAIKSNSSYREDIRREVRDSFSEFAKAMNQLIEHATDRVNERGLGRALLFIVDGTDRLGEEAEAFFIQDIHQLRFIRGNFVYCAPISILAEQDQVSQNYDAVFRLPMLKLSEKGEDERIEESWRSLREFVARRMPQRFFDGPETLDRLIECSGGHPRDLLRLVNLCFQELDDAPITGGVAEAAIRKLTSEYRRLIEVEDFEVLAEIDARDKSHVPVSERTRRLLYDLVLLEYNAFWWQSHPVVWRMEAYRDARERLDDGTAG